MHDDAYGEHRPRSPTLAWHAGAYAALNALLALLFALHVLPAANDGTLLPYWPLVVHVGWGMFLVAHWRLARKRGPR